MPAESFTPGINKLANAEKDFDSGIIVLGILALVFGFLLFFFFFLVFLLKFFNAFLSFIVFFLLFVVAERFSLFFHEGGDLFTVQVKKGILVQFFFGYLSGFVVLGLFLRSIARVIFLNFVDGFLIGVDLRKQLLQVGELNL